MPRPTALIAIDDDELRAAVTAELTAAGFSATPDTPHVDALVVSVGAVEPQPFDTQEPGRWFAEVSAALTSPFQRIRASVLSLEGGDRPSRIVVVGSGWDAAQAGRTGHAAVAGATIALVKTLARDLGPRGIIVNQVATTAAAHPEAVARAVAYLCSPDAEAVVGQVLTVGRGGEVRP